MCSGFGTVVIWGVGLIGGSIGMALRQRGLADEVIGIGRAGSAGVPEAVRLGAVDRMVTDPAAALARADLVILATPVQAMIDLAPQAAPFLRPGSIVTDVASVKAAVVAAWERHLPDGVAFVGGHPMFGRERSGVANASADLIPGCRWVLTPGERAAVMPVGLGREAGTWVGTQPGSPGRERGARAGAPCDSRREPGLSVGGTHSDGVSAGTGARPLAPAVNALERVRDLVLALGAEPVVMSPEQHDFRVAGASHLPQLVATALAMSALRFDEAHPGTLALAGGGFRDTTRIADSPAGLWHEIWAHNRPALQEAVGAFRAALAELEEAIAAGDAGALAALFEQAHTARRRARGRAASGAGVAAPQSGR
ncbi:MAG: prephenate dehydrogenase/arogenate dehydrogenase family protein [Symbiobacterium sp.]|uniref:prephenate dehydrogenase n=1 Tax=Symbiobacterium sp. TaxID=1971213 RepID=UPI0034647B73